jgi:SAM-dependent MidA family methyltransferase
MQVALYDPAHGYYNQPSLKRWGRTGDYRTSPERSELFAVTFARFFAKLFKQLEKPENWTIVESGAGNGEFAAGVLQTLKERFPDVFAATRYVIDEISADACRRLVERLGSFEAQIQYETLENLQPLNPAIFFSNELLDAFPVHLLTLLNGALAEFYVDLNKNDEFVFTTGPISSTRLNNFLTNESLELKEGQVIEANLRMLDWLGTVARKLKKGYVITVDYGAERGDLYKTPDRFRGTLRAFQRHRFVEDILSSPGSYDITSTVNWSQLIDHGSRLGLKLVSMTQLDQFLMQQGLIEELEQLLNTEASDAQKLVTSTAAREMILPGGMASYFQVLVQSRV